MDKVSIQSLNTMFEYFNQQPDTVLWMRSLDFQRQLYLSEKFEELWGTKSEHIYDNPSKWHEYLLEADKKRVQEHFKLRVDGYDKIDKDVLLYRMKDANQQVQFMRGTAFILTDQNNAHVAYAGITQKTSQRRWEEEFEKQKLKLQPHDPQAQLKKYLFDVLRNELRINAAPIHASNNQKIASVIDAANPTLCAIINNGRPVNLTQREIACLYHLISGKSAKQTGALLNISARTVEFHLNNIKDKAGCRTKLELLGKTIVKT